MPMDARRRVVVKTHPHDQGYFYIIDRGTTLVDIVLFVRSELGVTTPPERLKCFVNGIAISDTSFLFHGDEVVVTEVPDTDRQPDSGQEQEPPHEPSPNEGISVLRSFASPPGQVSEPEPTLTLDDGTVLTLNRKPIPGQIEKVDEKKPRDYRNGRCETTVDKINRFIKIQEALKTRPDILRTQVPSYFDGQKLLDEWKLDANFIVDYPTVKEALREAVKRRQQRAQQRGGRGLRAKRPPPVLQLPPQPPQDDVQQPNPSFSAPVRSRGRGRGRKASAGGRADHGTKESDTEGAQEMTSRTSGLRFDFTGGYRPRPTAPNPLMDTHQGTTLAQISSPPGHHTTDHTHELQPLRPLSMPAPSPTTIPTTMSGGDDDEGPIDVVDENQVDGYGYAHHDENLHTMVGGPMAHPNQVMFPHMNPLPHHHPGAMPVHMMTNQMMSSGSEGEGRFNPGPHAFALAAQPHFVHHGGPPGMMHFGHFPAMGPPPLPRMQHPGTYPIPQHPTPVGQPRKKTKRGAKESSMESNTLTAGRAQPYSTLASHGPLPALLPITSVSGHPANLPALGKVAISSGRASPYAPSAPGPTQNMAMAAPQSLLPSLDTVLQPQQTYAQVAPSAPYSPPHNHTIQDPVEEGLSYSSESTLPQLGGTSSTQEAEVATHTGEHMEEDVKNEQDEASMEENVENMSDEHMTTVHEETVNESTQSIENETSVHDSLEEGNVDMDVAGQQEAQPEVLRVSEVMPPLLDEMEGIAREGVDSGSTVFEQNGSMVTSHM